ncbi:hypothetical protein ACFQU2_01880 [Siccirubricoccus deserti]
MRVGLPAARPDAALRQAVEMLRLARVGGAPGLPDPGAMALGHAHGAAVLVVDPCDPALAGAAARMLETARRGAAGRPVLVAASPAAPPAAKPTLPTTLPGRLAPWTLLDLAAELHSLGDELGLLALIAGVTLRDHAGAPWAGPPPEQALAALFAATRWVDPFRGTPWSAAEGIAQLAAWREAEAANRSIRACVGIEWFKHRHIRDALASAAGPPRMVMRGSSAIRVARREGGAVAVWASVMPAGLRVRAAAAGVPLVRLEDGFIRSAGLGVLLAPAASLVIDGQGIHYDPGQESALEALLARTEFPCAARPRGAAAAGAAGGGDHQVQSRRRRPGAGAAAGAAGDPGAGAGGG